MGSGSHDLKLTSHGKGLWILLLYVTSVGIVIYTYTHQLEVPVQIVTKQYPKLAVENIIHILKFHIDLHTKLKPFITVLF